jgi:hypothetical protein
MPIVPSVGLFIPAIESRVVLLLFPLAPQVPGPAIPGIESKVIDGENLFLRGPDEGEEASPYCWPVDLRKSSKGDSVVEEFWPRLTMTVRFFETVLYKRRSTYLAMNR